MAWLSTGITLLLAGLLLRELASLLRARVPTQTRAVLVGDGAPPCQDDIPKVIWTHAPGAAPAFLRACLANWRQFAPDHEVRLLDRDGIASWLPGLEAPFDALPPAQRADWLGAQLLARHGGIWMDAGLLLSRDLAWLHETRRRRAAEQVGFYIDRDTTRPELPLMATWLMASVPGGRLATALAAAFDAALSQGPEALLQRLQGEGRQARVAQGLGEAAQRRQLLQLVASDWLDRHPEQARLVLLRAEDGPLAWAAGLGWRPRKLYARLALLPCPRVLPAVLRLDEDERRLVERRWGRRLVSPFSALAQLLDRTA